MDFILYDNVFTYNKMHSARELFPETDIPIYQMIITPRGALWIYTKYDKTEENVNINVPYLHVHAGINAVAGETEFEDKVWYIEPRKDVIYDPKKKQVIFYKPGSFPWPWRKPLKIKGVAGRYYGRPITKKHKVSSNWRYDLSQKTIHIILNYYGGKNEKFPDRD